MNGVPGDMVAVAVVLVVTTGKVGASKTVVVSGTGAGVPGKADLVVTDAVGGLIADMEVS